MVSSAEAFLEKLSGVPDQSVDLAETALGLAALDSPGISVDRYRHHLKVLSDEVGERHLELLKAGADDNLETRLAALKHVISDKHAYIGDAADYESLDNISLIRVIDQAKGIPITLSILYIHVARAQGWAVAGLNLPGHFVCRLEDGAQRVIFDPFDHCKVLEAPDLRLIVKKMLGNHAELSASYFEPCSNREILIRLQNNLKHRLIEDEDYSGALRVVERMRLIDPDEYRLLFDAGILYARIDQNFAAIEALEDYLGRVPQGRDWDNERHDALLLLDELRGRLN